MGADGHIAIYDWSKTVKQFPELQANGTLVRLVIGDAYIYDNPFGEGELLVVYWGDNLLESIFPGYECIWAKKYTENGFAIRKEYEPYFKEAKEIVSWMERNAVIVYDWEVWT